MTEKQIRKYLRRRFSPAGWTLIGYFLIMNIMVALPMLLQAARLTLTDSGAAIYDAISGNAWGYLYTVLVGLVILTGWKGLPFWTQEVWRPRGKMTAHAFAACLSVFVSLQLVFSVWMLLLEWILTPLGVDISASVESASGESTTVSMLLYSAVVAPLSEELLFRGLLLGSFRPYGKRFAIFASALLFGLFHGNLVQTPYAFFAGLVLGYVAEEYGLWWSAALHFFNNFILGEILPMISQMLTLFWAENLSGLVVIFFTGLAAVFLLHDREALQIYRYENPMDTRCVACFLTCGGTIAAIVVFFADMLMLLG